MLKEGLEHPLKVASLTERTLGIFLSANQSRRRTEIGENWTPWKEQNGEKEIEDMSLVINSRRLQSHSSLPAHCHYAFLNKEEKLGLLNSSNQLMKQFYS